MMRKTLLLMLLLIANPGIAECMRESSGQSICGQGPCAKNIRGQVHCANDRYGTATRDSRGNVVCGPGKCAKDLQGNIHCSSKSGGDAIRDGRGGVECLGACQLASPEFCERVPASQ
jgi:hypothetical protein